MHFDKGCPHAQSLPLITRVSRPGELLEDFYLSELLLELLPEHSLFEWKQLECLVIHQAQDGSHDITLCTLRFDHHLWRHL
jgi:hypothetical protein